MRLCLLRHAIAVEREGGGYKDDRARPLTAEGRKRTSEASAGLLRLLKPDAIFTSSVLRARQTADILGRACEIRPRELEALGRGDHDGTVAALQPGGTQTVVLVGHEPWMSELLSMLLCGQPQAVQSDFKKSAAAITECDGAPAFGNFRLVAFLPPAVLRRMA
ncbi:MAG: histidine phosphatase family protein [bacterium]